MERESFAHGLGVFLRGSSSNVAKVFILGLFMLVGGATTAALGRLLILSTPDRHLSSLYARALLQDKASDVLPGFDEINTEWEGQQLSLSPRRILESERAISAWNRSSAVALTSSLIGLVLAFLGWRVALARLTLLGESLRADKHVRGSQIADEEMLREASLAVIKRTNEKGPHVHYGRVPIARSMEPRGAMIMGSIGSGKTTAIRQILEVVERRGEAAIVYDPSLSLLAAYFDIDRGDIILNPFDERGGYWSPFDELRTRADADAIARMLVLPEGEEKPDQWIEATRTLVSAIIWKLYESGRGQLDELIDVLGNTDTDDLKSLVAGTPAARLFSAGAERATGSVLFMLPKALKALAPLRRAPGAGGTFSWRSHIASLDQVSNRRRWVFLGAPPDQQTTLRPLLGAWVTCLVSSVLSQREDESRRLWVVLDEFPTLPPLEDVSRLPAEGRKFGAATIIGLQAPAQAERLYKKEGMIALASTLATHVYLRMTGQSATWASDAIGKYEIEAQRANDQLQMDDAADGTTLGAQRLVQAAVLDGEIANLQDREAFLRLPGGLPVGRVVIPRDNLDRPDRAKGFMPGSDRDTYLVGVLGSDAAPEKLPAPEEKPAPKSDYLGL